MRWEPPPEPTGPLLMRRILDCAQRPIAESRPYFRRMTGYPTPTAATLCEFAREVLADERMRSQGLRHGAPDLSDPKA